MRSNSTWNRFTREQRERLEIWLFNENLGYAKTVARVQMEFGIQTSIAGVGRYYRRRAQQRQAQELKTRLTADGLNGRAMDADSLWATALKLVGNTTPPGRVKEPDESSNAE